MKWKCDSMSRSESQGREGDNRRFPPGSITRPSPGTITLPVKKLVYEMRFDEVSAKYADFGQFYIGVKFEPGDLAGAIGSSLQK